MVDSLKTSQGKQALFCSGLFWDGLFWGALFQAAHIHCRERCPVRSCTLKASLGLAPPPPPALGFATLTRHRRCRHVDTARRCDAARHRRFVTLPLPTLPDAVPPADADTAATPTLPDADAAATPTLRGADAVRR